MICRLFEEKGDTVAMYGFIVVVLALCFIGIKSCAQGGFRARLQELSDDFVSRQDSDEAAARRLEAIRSRSPKARGSDPWAVSGGPIKPAVSPETSRIIQEHSMGSSDPD